MADKRKTRKRREEFGEKEEVEKPSKQEYAVAKWLRANIPTKKTKFLNHHVEYFTGSKAVDALLTSKWSTGNSPLFTTRQEISEFLNDMLVHKFFHRAKKVPVTEQELKKSKKKDGDKTTKSGDESKDNKEDKSSNNEVKDQKEKEKEKEKRKRKIRLEMHLDQYFVDGSEAYVWIYDPIPLWYWLAGFAVVLGAIGICMFPLWPPTVRKGVYYLSIAAAGFLVFIIALAIIRVIVFCLVWILTLSKHHIWLLPNLTADVGFFESFWPLYHYEYKGQSADQDKDGKCKKKRKKAKCSDDEVDESEQLLKEQPDTQSNKTATQTDKDESNKNTKEMSLEEKQSESESENSQRSSTGRDFEMVDPGDVDTS